MPMTYETDRGVFFNPNEVQLDKCLKCARPTTRRSPRNIATLVRGGPGRLGVRSMTNALTLCERCDRRWDIAVGIGFASFAMPFAVPIAAVAFHAKVMPLPDRMFGPVFLLGFALAIAMYIYAVRASIRVRSIDDDGLIGIDNVHPEVRAEIVARGMSEDPG